MMCRASSLAEAETETLWCTNTSVEERIRAILRKQITKNRLKIHIPRDIFISECQMTCHNPTWNGSSQFRLSLVEMWPFPYSRICWFFRHRIDWWIEFFFCIYFVWISGFVWNKPAKSQRLKCYEYIWLCKERQVHEKWIEQRSRDTWSAFV